MEPTNLSSYKQVINYLYSQLPVYQRQGKAAVKKDLSNIIKLCQHLGDPQRRLRCVHVAGTNGKGSVSHLIAAILQAQGARVGLYTSPHYMDFRERIKINGDWISEQAVVEFVNTHRALIEDVQPSFFEITVAMAFDYFAREGVDFAVIETGLGGRLDSTNIIQPLLSVITHISLDHQDMLGDTVYQIAHEKAGIIKDNTPTVVGRYQRSCDEVFYRIAKARQSPLSFANLAWKREGDNIIASAQEKISVSPAGESPFYVENCITAIQAAKVLAQLGYIQWSVDTLTTALRTYRDMTQYIGRWQLLDKHPMIITDSAHNEDAIKQLFDHLQSYSYKCLHIVWGMAKGKDIAAIIQLMPKSAQYYFCAPDLPRAMAADDWQYYIDNYGFKGKVWGSLAAAYSAAVEAAGPSDLIYVGGSSYLVGEFLANRHEASGN